MKPERFGNKRLNFKCHQDIAKMPDTHGGKYCQLCNKALIDFRDKSYRQFKEFTKDKGDYCGIYYAEQVNDAYSVDLDYRRPLLILTTIGSLLGLTNIPTFAQEITKPKTEQTSTTQNNPLSVVTDTTAAHCMRKKCGKQTETLEYARKHKLIETYRKIIYFSKRFPFIKVKRKRIVLMGF